MWRIVPPGLGTAAWGHTETFKRGAEVRLKTHQGPGAYRCVHVLTGSTNKELIGIESH